jgi:hypothetical protein
MQPREGKLHLRLDTGGTLHPATRRLLDDVIQQRRLAHARLATHHERSALARANGFDHPVEHIAFAAPTLELCGTSSDGGVRGHVPGT